MTKVFFKVKQMLQVDLNKLINYLEENKSYTLFKLTSKQLFFLFQFFI